MTGNNRVAWLNPGDPPEAFPDPGSALREPNGLLAAGGDLSSARLLHAYRHGIFPWYDAGQPILWWSPDPRCVLYTGDYHVSRRLRKTIRKSSAMVTVNRDFADVIERCAGPRRSGDGTWITPEMKDAYLRLHEEGWAHSIEVRDGTDLIGGIYGVSIGNVFFGESMFSDRADASKLGMLALCGMLSANNVELIDCQVVSRHLATLGATTIPRDRFLATLNDACEPLRPFDNWPRNPLPVAALETPSAARLS